MSEFPEPTLEDYQAGMRECISAAESLLRLKPIRSDPNDPYTPYLNEALGSVLHLLAVTARDAILSQTPDEPWIDFGAEPLSVEDAEAKLPEFLRVVQSVFFESPGPYPFCCADIRATTFAHFFLPPT